MRNLNLTRWDKIRMSSVFLIFFFVVLSGCSNDIPVHQPDQKDTAPPTAVEVDDPEPTEDPTTPEPTETEEPTEEPTQSNYDRTTEIFRANWEDLSEAEQEDVCIDYLLNGTDDVDWGTADEEAVKDFLDAACEEQANADEPDMSMEESNAVDSAESYLSFMGFSRSGLIEQLEFEGYSNDAATFAVDYLDVDWNEQAEKAAESYIDAMSFSRSGLIDQLEFDGFTHEQAVHGAEAVGY